MKRSRTVLEIGGYAAGAILVAFGIAAIVMGINGRSTVRSNIQQEYIVGSADMTPAAIADEVKQAGLPTSTNLPTCDVADQSISNGDQARCFAQYIRIHALEATGGKTYAQLPRFATADGKGTNDAAQASKDENGQPVANAIRDLWVTATALSTALNTSYMAERIALFGIVVGVALLLTGIGLLILAAAVFHRRHESVPESVPVVTPTGSPAT